MMVNREDNLSARLSSNNSLTISPETAISSIFFLALSNYKVWDETRSPREIGTLFQLIRGVINHSISSRLLRTIERFVRMR